MKLKDVITCAVNGLEAGVDTKREAIDAILSYVNNNYTANEDVEVVHARIFAGTDSEGKHIKVAGVII